MYNKKTRQAVINATLAAGSVESPYYYDVNMTQILCKQTCADEVPVFNPTFSLVGTSMVGTGQYMATIHVEGVVAYTPCYCGSCCTMSQVISQNFDIPFYSATAPTSVTISTGTTVNSVNSYICSDCTNEFVCSTPLSLIVTA